MDDTRKIEFRVGIFVFIGIIVICAMILEFGQLERFYRPTYRVNLVFDNVGGLVVKGSVRFAGVKVGRVKAITLNSTGDRKVYVVVEIDEKIQVRRDSRFAIHTTGMLGDQYIDIEPVPGSQEPFLKEGDEMVGTPPVDFGAVADRVKHAIDKIDKAILDDATLNALHDTITNAQAATEKLNQQVLGEGALTDYRKALANLRDASEAAKTAAAEVEKLAKEGRPQIEEAVQRIKAIAEKTDATVARADKILAENEKDLKALVQNTNASSEKMKTILTRLEAGEGTLGQLLTDKSLHEELKKLVENWRRYGLLYKEPKPRPVDEPKKSSSSRPGLREQP